MLFGNEEATSLSEAENLARNRPGTTVNIPAYGGNDQPPPRYRPCPPPYSLPKGEIEAYRTAQPKGHHHLRIYEDRWAVEYDRYHPEHYPLQHAFVDARMYAALVVAAIGGGAVFSSYSISRARRS